MIEEKFRGWSAFRNRLLAYAALDRKRRDQLIFRGQPDSRWALVTTLDRNQTFADDGHRSRYYDDLLVRFRREVITLGMESDRILDSEGFELLARHHGLPTPYIDWTESPFIASFFAYQAAPRTGTKSVAVWVLDRARFSPGEELGVSLIDEPGLIRYNPRAISQRGVFLRIDSTRATVIEMLDRALTKFILPIASRKLALAELDEMKINGVELFRDLDSAARTAVYRASFDLET